MVSILIIADEWTMEDWKDTLIFVFGKPASCKKCTDEVIIKKQNGASQKNC